jgi:hypothetical protein
MRRLMCLAGEGLTPSGNAVESDTPICGDGTFAPTFRGRKSVATMATTSAQAPESRIRRKHLKTPSLCLLQICGTRYFEIELCKENCQ